MKCCAYIWEHISLQWIVFCAFLLVIGLSAGITIVAFLTQRQYESVQPIITILCVSSFIALFVSFFLTRVLVHPYEDLVETLRKFAYDHHISSEEIIMSHGNEIWFLSQILKTMMHHIESSYQELEHHVDERTIELQERIIQLETARQQLAVREKFALTGELLTGIAHEIKNPLTVVFGCVELLQARIKCISDAKAVQYIQELHQYVTRTVSVVHQMLRFARVGEEQKEEIDICDLLIMDAKLVERSTGVHIDMMLTSQITQLEVFPNDLSRAIVNVLLNACYAVTHTKEPRTPKVHLNTYLENTMYCIHIQDNGDGISPDYSHRIFEPFFTTKPSGEGSGLGLSLVHDIIHLEHNGSITTESSPGKTVFLIKLPIK